ncbi:hypothetical protein SBOR_5603 [Sclerotinia borealis F-4128]|uniref:Nitrogen permease regulator 3 n=1 Tax=Sclerotinia borealis (strain F-4128) TaxID=1432307 RepID=W9CHK4_SCLBF|nr:hypothetical protein SBOR_5603 [Sclerotinia borealis F-4128]
MVILESQRLSKYFQNKLDCRDQATGKFIINPSNFNFNFRNPSLQQQTSGIGTRSLTIDIRRSDHQPNPHGPFTNMAPQNKQSSKQAIPSKTQSTTTRLYNLQGRIISMDKSEPFIDSGLIAVSLVIKSQTGPNFVFHYPPRPSFAPPPRNYRYGTETDQSELEEQDESDEDDSDDFSDLEDSITSKFGKINMGGKKVNSGNSRSRHVEIEGDDHYESKDGEQIVPWEQFGEFPTVDLASILTPPRAYHKKKFELSIDNLYFVSYPLHIREDGFWKKPRKSKKGKEVAKDGDEVDEGQAKKGSGSDDGDDRGAMTMFNVVFVVSLPRHEQDERIEELYEHVIKTFNKALNHAQAQSNYVWKESEIILNMKERAREDKRPMSQLWSQILIKSTLADAMRNVYDAVVNNTITTVCLDTKPPIDLSLHIPIPTFLMSFPNPNERAKPGVLLSSANPLVDEEGNPDPMHLDKHFALLLLKDEVDVIAEISSENTELSTPLIQVIKWAKPTLSFHQVAQTNNVDLDEVITLAQHLIYWRKAIAIPPIHARDMFIVSPNCDMHKLIPATQQWKKAFPFAPSLQSFLGQISYAPRAYKTFVPSKSHREKYMEMLAWLIRGGWVTHLRTFCWIWVWPEIIYEVEYQLKAEAIERTRNPPLETAPGSPETNNSEEATDAEKAMALDPTAPLTTEQAAEAARLERLAAKTIADAKAAEVEFEELPVPVATEHPSMNHAEHLKYMSSYAIVDPHKANHVETMYIAAIGKRWTDPKAKALWPKFVKYFNGTTALEDIWAKEGLKRKETWNILLAYQEQIMVMKHW